MTDSKTEQKLRDAAADFLDGMAEPVLLPCPFCGEDEAMLHWDATPGGPKAAVHCMNCRASADEFITEEQAIKAWNTRSKALDDE